jgi:hypothetical protein
LAVEFFEDFSAEDPSAQGEMFCQLHGLNLIAQMASMLLIFVRAETGQRFRAIAVRVSDRCSDLVDTCAKLKHVEKSPQLLAIHFTCYKAQF